GADTVMDLSTGGDIDAVRRAVIKKSRVPVGTVPVYQAIVEKHGIDNVSSDDFLNAIQKHINDGVDFITVHSGVTRAVLPHLPERTAGVVSRGGTFLVRWMKQNNAENPLYENFDSVLEMAREHDVTLSLGDGLRPGCIADATDSAQLTELKTLGNLVLRSREAGVQVIVEGPGHVPLHEIKKNIALQKQHCHGAPFYVLGPLVTDIAPGYDHITSAIGGALAAYYGASFLCCVTPAEHLRLPDVDDLKEGVISSKIAAHAADVARGIPHAAALDLAMARARKKLDWAEMEKLSIDGEKFRRYRAASGAKGDECTMCGDFCVMKVLKDDE
ncbi:phosphomethylpyrimidine synthase ThiC, partial [Candidatus Micrarchaeota archaeon]|nr:phosphomethylpyrimidine synthase ThiC [Candidatus Micrarchaeota archaeon]